VSDDTRVLARAQALRREFDEAFARVAGGDDAPLEDLLETRMPCGSPSARGSSSIAR